MAKFWKELIGGQVKNGIYVAGPRHASSKLASFSTGSPPRLRLRARATPKHAQGVARDTQPCHAHGAAKENYRNHYQDREDHWQDYQE